MSKKRYRVLPIPGADDAVIVERKYGYEWREVGRYPTVEDALVWHPTARDRHSEKWLSRRAQ